MTHDDIDNAARAAKAEAKRQGERREALAEIRDLVEVMNTAAGRSLIHRLLSRAGVFRISFSGDPHQTAFNEGQRNIGLWVLTEAMSHTPEQYALMLKENADD